MAPIKAITVGDDHVKVFRTGDPLYRVVAKGSWKTMKFLV
jgi:hypothetical protein